MSLPHHGGPAVPQMPGSSVGRRGVGSALGTPWDPHASSWQDTRSGGIPTYPGKGQVHLQLGDAASNTGTNPVTKGDGAEGVVRRAVSPEPALRQEPLRLGEVGLIVGHCVVSQDKEGLQGKNLGLMTPPGPTECSGGPHSTAPTHILGEEVVSDDNVLLIEDPGVGGHHRVDSGIWGELRGGTGLIWRSQGEQDTGRTRLSSSPWEEVDICSTEGLKPSLASCLLGASPLGKGL